MGNTNDAYRDARALPIGDRDLIVARTDLDEEDAPSFLANLEKTILATNPNWCRVVVLLRPDQSLERMPEPVARQLYALLRGMFEPTEVQP